MSIDICLLVIIFCILLLLIVCVVVTLRLFKILEEQQSRIEALQEGLLGADKYIDKSLRELDSRILDNEIEIDHLKNANVNISVKDAHAFHSTIQSEKH